MSSSRRKPANSSVIGKIDKAHRYAQERERIRFQALSLDFHGDNDDHKVSLADEKWSCSCESPASRDGESMATSTAVH